MPGLDDAGVHGSDRNLVHAVAGDADERVLLLARLPFRRRFEIAAQRKAVDRPARLPQPRSLIVGVRGDAGRSNAARCIRFAAGKIAATIGIVRLRSGSVCSSTVRPSASSSATRRQKPRSRSRSSLAHSATSRPPLPTRDGTRSAAGRSSPARAAPERLTAAWRRRVRGGRRPCVAAIAVQPIKRAACRYHSARNGGIHRPSISTSAR